jgi:capsular exopolysaccharide synthesis family protein
LETSEYIDVIRVRKWLIIWTAIIVTLGATAISALQPATYEGTATLLYSQRNTGAAVLGMAQPQSSNFPDIELSTQIGLIQQPAVVEEVIHKLGLSTTVDKLLQTLTVSADGQTQLITITATGNTPEAAAGIADALANSYAGWSRTQNQKSIQAALDAVQANIASTQSQSATLQATVASQPTAANQAALLAANTRLSTLSDNAQHLIIAKTLETGSVDIVTPGTADPIPVSPKPVRNGALGLALGLGLGLGMAFLTNILDSTVKSSEEASNLYGAPVIGQIVEEKRAPGTPQLPIILAEPGSQAAESYRGLRNNIEFINFDRSIKTLLVTSSVSGEGKSTVAANMATAMARAGWKVVLLVIDFRRAAAEETFGMERSPGLSEVLAGSARLESVVLRPIQGLRLIPSGSTPPNPNELLGSRAMLRLLAALGESADLIIVDTPPLLAVADAATVARFSDAAVLVTRDGITTRDAARKARQQLDRVGERIIGVVVTGVKESSAERSNYDVYSGYPGRA